VKAKQDSLGTDFSKLFSALVATKLGDGLIAAAGPLLAANLTDDPFLIALMGALYMLPWLLFAIPIGTMVDRLNRRRVLTVVNFTRAAIAAVLTTFLATGTLTLAVFYFALFLVGVCDVISDTATQSLVPTMLRRDQLERGNSRIQAVDTIFMGFIGAPLGGFLFTIAAVTPWAVQSVSFLAASILVATIPISLAAGAASAAARTENFVEQMRGGVSYLWNDGSVGFLLQRGHRHAGALRAKGATSTRVFLWALGNRWRYRRARWSLCCAPCIPAVRPWFSPWHWNHDYGCF
jgi:MFS family permease